ncbi:MAG: spore germination protein [Mahellales bacterium]
MTNSGKLSKKLRDNIDAFSEKLAIDINFDIILRRLRTCGKEAAIIFVDGFTKDDMMFFILKMLQETTREEIAPASLEKIVETKIPYIETELQDEFDLVIDRILSGMCALIIDGFDRAILLDTREYPARTPEESDLERVTRGSRDGLVETIVFNTALIRRRIRDPKLRNEILSVGNRSKSDVVVSYIQDIANPNLVNKVKEKIKNINTDSLEMSEKTLEEFIIGRSWNPLPKIRYTERPDVAAAHLLEGHIIVIVDTSPSVMILPVSVFHFTQHAEDYYQAPTVGTYLRWVRLLSILISFVLVPLWLLLVQNKAGLPQWLKFLGPKEQSALPLLLQFIILEFGIDILRMASIHTPNALTTSLGIIGALLLGELAIEVGMFVPETILYMAFTAICSFAIPSIEFALAIKLFRLLLLILTGLFNYFGFIAGILFTLIILVTTKSFGGTNYLWPLIPLDTRSLKTIFVRKPIPEVKYRPSFLRNIDKDSSS